MRIAEHRAGLTGSFAFVTSARAGRARGRATWIAWRTPIASRFATIDEPPTLTIGKRDAGHRRDPDRHADVDEDLEQEREHDPAGDDRRERVSRGRDDLQPAPDDEQVEHQQEAGAEEAALLGERGEREVGRVLGQELEARLRGAGDAAARRSRRSRPR